MIGYGKEIILDLHCCDPDTFTRKSIRKYFKELCKLIDMQPEKICWWDDLYTPKNEKETELHLVGTSAIQFIKTSNITIHTLDLLGQVYVNIFSCKDFNSGEVLYFTKRWFKGTVVQHQNIKRL